MFKPKRRSSKTLSGSGSYWYLWWLNPIVVLSLMLMVTGASAYLIPGTDYVLNWRTPKYVGNQEFLYIIYVVLAFSAGGLVVKLASVPIPYLTSDQLLSALRVPWKALLLVFFGSFFIIMLAYAIWLCLLISGGLSLSSLMAGLQGQQGAAYDIREQGGTLPGITTFVQMEMGFVIIGLILVFKMGWKRHFSTLVIPMIIVLLIAWIRSKIWSERLAVMELLIPAVVLSVRLAKSEKWKPWQRSFMAFAPLAGPPFLFLFFSAAEYSRSWTSFYSETQSSFLMFSFMRLIGYYVTALNNGAALVEVMHHYDVPFHTLDWFWRFPLIRTLMPYKAIANAEPWDDYHDLLSHMANPEFNNPSGVFVVRLDYGYIGGLLVWFAFGAIAMLLYRSFMKGSVVGLLLYPFFFIGLLESPRVLYWCGARCFPTWGLLLAVLLLVLFTSQAMKRKTELRGGLVRGPRNIPDLWPESQGRS